MNRISYYCIIEVPISTHIEDAFNCKYLFMFDQLQDFIMLNEEHHFYRITFAFVFTSHSLRLRKTVRRQAGGGRPAGSY